MRFVAQDRPFISAKYPQKYEPEAKPNTNNDPSIPYIYPSALNEDLESSIISDIIPTQ